MENDIYKAIRYFRAIRRLMLKDISDEYDNGKITSLQEDEDASQDV